MTDPTDDTPDLARAVEAVRALHDRPHWCFTYSEGDDEPRHDVVVEPGTEWWPCPTLAAILAHQPDRATQPTEAALTDPFVPVEWQYGVTQESDGVVRQLHEEGARRVARHGDGSNPRHVMRRPVGAWQRDDAQPTAEPRTVETDERGGES